MFVATALATAFAFVPLSEKWEIRPPMETGPKAAWTVTVAAKVMGEDHEALFTLTRTLEKGETTETIKNLLAWTDISVDGSSLGMDLDFDMMADKNMMLLSTSSELGDDMRRMMTPLNFVYPPTSVGVGDKWTAEWKRAESRTGAIALSYEVLAAEKLGDVETLKIKSNLEEEGAAGMKGSGTWWVDRQGNVRQFEVDVRNWVVPVAGPETVDATIKGVLKTPR